MSTSQQPTLFCLHGLGLSARAFDGLANRLEPDFDVVAIDLPGFGDVSAASGLTVDEMVAHVARRIRRHGSSRFALVGHSMGGKVASLVARQILDGVGNVFGLAGVVLLAGSPPTPEPMGDDQRATMLGWAAAGSLGPGEAKTFIDDNVGAPLDPESDALARADVERSSAEAWTAWFARGSLEDRGSDVGVLDVPALIVAGGADGPLGEEGQRETNAHVYPRADVVVLPGAGHLLMLERPDEVAELIRDFWRSGPATTPTVSADFGRMIASTRTSSQTRAILAGRALGDDGQYEPRILSPGQLATLRLVADRVVPQGPPDAPEPGDAGGPGAPAFDIAARVDSGLDRGVSDGWRNAALPSDQEAYRLGLDELVDFADLSDDERDSRIQAIVDQTYAPTRIPWTAQQMTLWFEDCRVDLTRTWLAHPATMERIGFDGFANGGDTHRIQGFELLGAGLREAWEPAMSLSAQTPVSTQEETTR